MASDMSQQSEHDSWYSSVLKWCTKKKFWVKYDIFMVFIYWPSWISQVPFNKLIPWFYDFRSVFTLFLNSFADKPSAWGFIGYWSKCRNYFLWDTSKDWMLKGLFILYIRLNLSGSLFICLLSLLGFHNNWKGAYLINLVRISHKMFKLFLPFLLRHCGKTRQMSTRKINQCFY